MIICFKVRPSKYVIQWVDLFWARTPKGQTFLDPTDIEEFMLL